MKLKYIASLSTLLLLGGCNMDNTDYSEPVDMQGVSSLHQDFAAAMGYENERVFYGFDQYKVKISDKAKVRKMVEWLNSQAANTPDMQISIEGHCDERGTSEYNMGLGMRRAEALKREMLNQGLECSNITVVSFGKERPAVNARTEAEHAKNRRAVVVLLGD